MPKAAHRVFDFGRVFFPRKDDRTIPDQILFQPLGNHVANVRKLVHCWKRDDFSQPNLDESLKRVSEAARLHDIGKPQRFSVNVKVQANKIEFGYSFRGHRFLAIAPEQPWVESLAKGHHDFSAHDICRDTYILKTLLNKMAETDPYWERVKNYKDTLESYPLAYAHELYVLEMCDQIEAEIACRFYEEWMVEELTGQKIKESEQAETRAFMDFVIIRENKEFFLDPWVFDETRDEIELTLATWSMPFPDEIRKALVKATQDEDSALTKKLQDSVEKWWRSQSTNQQSEKHKVVIKRLPRDEGSKLDSKQIYKAVGGFTPNPMQQELAQELDQKQNPHPAILLKAPTGTGKTEAILFPALANNYRLFLILPTRSLLEDQRERIHGYLERFSDLEQNYNCEISLVVDTGAEMERWLYVKRKAKKPKVRPRRHLYKGNIILTTLDKFLYRYFSFGDKQKSFIFPHRIHRENTLICFDEAHSYDDISFTNFQSLVRSLYEAGRSLVLMTATMPPQLEEYFDYLQVIDYTKPLTKLADKSFVWRNDIPCYREHEGEKNFTDFQNQFSQLVLQECQSNPNRRIIAVVETVRDAVEIYKQLKEHFGSNTDQSGRFLFLYHGRIADQLRPDIYKAIKERDNKKQPYILVTTSAIEVGCDLNAEVLISQICPPENLIQRAGRCNRRGDVTDARVILVGDLIPDFANSLDEDGWQNYKATLSKLKKFETERVAECIFHALQVNDYRVVELFSMLHDYVYGADLNCQSTHERGLIPTRSWEPSVELRFMFSEQDYRSISVPIARLAEKKGQQYAYTYAFERRYDKESTRWQELFPWWGSAYRKNIVVKIHPASDNCNFDRKLPEYEYSEELGFVDLPKVFSAKWVDGAEVKLKYEEGDRKAIISYIKSLD